jgi:hypothetical protein
MYTKMVVFAAYFCWCVGGLIMFFVLRKKNRGMAKNGLFLGFVLEAVHIVGMLAINSFTTNPF